MSTASDHGAHSSRTGPPVRCLSVPKSGTITVRLLGPYFGFQTHYKPKVPVYCPGPAECPAPIHRTRSIWKGYAPAELWVGGERNVWEPWVLEVTERLGELWDGIDLRASVWILSRQVVRQNVREINATFLEQHNADQVRAVFSIVPTISRLYGRADFHFTNGPALPPRLFLDAVPGIPPISDVAPKNSDTPLTPAEFAALKDRMKAVFKPSHTKNGSK